MINILARVTGFLGLLVGITTAMIFPTIIVAVITGTDILLNTRIYQMAIYLYKNGFKAYVRFTLLNARKLRHHYRFLLQITPAANNVIKAQNFINYTKTNRIEQMKITKLC